MDIYILPKIMSIGNISIICAKITVSSKMRNVVITQKVATYFDIFDVPVLHETETFECSVVQRYFSKKGLSLKNLFLKDVNSMKNLKYFLLDIL